MIYRVAVLTCILLASASSAYAAGQKGWSFRGTCDGNISQSDGAQTGAGSGTMSTKDYFALMKRARESHMTLGADGFLWTQQPLHCDSIVITQFDDHEGHTAVSFSNGDPANPILIFAGDLIGGDGPLFFPHVFYLSGQKAVSLSPGGNGKACHFYFATGGGFAQGWENRITAVECELREKTEDGHLISASVAFKVIQTPIAQ